ATVLQPEASSQIADGFGLCDGRGVQDDFRNDASAETRQRDAKLSLRNAAELGMVPLHGSGGDGRSGGLGASAAADENVQGDSGAARGNLWGPRGADEDCGRRRRRVGSGK